MIEEVVSVDLAVHERLTVRKNRLAPKQLTGNEKRISIVTGTHGDELDGQYVCYEIVKQLNAHPEKLKGIVDIYPDVNPLGLDTGSRGIPMFDLDMNRVFPGDNNGAITEYLAAGIIDDDNEEKLLPYAKLLNADFVWIYSSITVLEATLAYSLNNMGVPTLVVEMGVGHRINNAYCHQLIDGIFNMLIHMGIWEDEAPQVKQPIISTEGEVSIINAAQTGVFVAATDHMGAIEMGTHIGDIIEPIEGKVIQRIESPTNGIIFTLRENPVVYKGALIARVYGGKA